MELVYYTILYFAMLTVIYLLQKGCIIFHKNNKANATQSDFSTNEEGKLFYKNDNKIFKTMIVIGNVTNLNIMLSFCSLELLLY